MSPVISVVFSSDGEYVVSVSNDHTMRIWASATWEGLNQFPGVGLSLDGKWAVTASEDATVRVWNAETGESLAELHGHTHPVRSAAFSPNGKSMATAARTARREFGRSGRGEVCP